MARGQRPSGGETGTYAITSTPAGRPTEPLRLGNHWTRRALATDHHRRALRSLSARTGGYGAPLRRAERSAGLRERGAVVISYTLRVYADADRCADCDRATDEDPIRRGQEGLWQASQRAKAAATPAETARAPDGDALRDGDARADGNRHGDRDPHGDGHDRHIVRVIHRCVAGGATGQLLHALRGECGE
jgi:hypothetical protein